MATNYLSLTGLTTYDGLIKQFIADADAVVDAKSVKVITLDQNTGVVSFYKTDTATGTPYFTFTIPTGDISALAQRVTDLEGLVGEESVASQISGAIGDLDASDSAVSGQFVTSVSEADGVITVTRAALAASDIPEIPQSKVTNLTTDLAAKATPADITSAIEALDATETQTAGTDGLALSITEVDGVITSISGSIAANTYDAHGAAASAKSEVIGQSGDASTANTIYGAKAYADEAVAGIALDADNISYDNTTSGLTADDVQEAIDEIVGGLGTAAAADVATSPIQEQSADDGLVSAAQVATFVASEIEGLEGAMHFRGVIVRQTGETDAQAIARVITDPEAGDTVVMSDNAKEYIYTNSTIGWREVGDETEFVKKSTTIAGVDLEDNITASELQTALGLGTAAYTAATAYDAAGTASGLIAALDASVSASGTAQHSGTFVVSGVTEVDGVITAVTSTEVEAAGAAAAAKSEVIGQSGDASTANTIYGAKAYADSLTAAIPDSDIEALFD